MFCDFFSNKMWVCGWKHCSVASPRKVLQFSNQRCRQRIGPLVRSGPLVTKRYCGMKRDILKVLWNHQIAHPQDLPSETQDSLIAAESLIEKGLVEDAIREYEYALNWNSSSKCQPSYQTASLPSPSVFQKSWCITKITEMGRSNWWVPKSRLHCGRSW